jgi:hypothetical protein
VPRQQCPPQESLENTEFEHTSSYVTHWKRDRKTVELSCPGTPHHHRHYHLSNGNRSILSIWVSRVNDPPSHQQPTTPLASTQIILRWPITQRTATLHQRRTWRHSGSVLWIMSRDCMEYVLLSKDWMEWTK